MEMWGGMDFCKETAEAGVGFADHVCRRMSYCRIEEPQQEQARKAK
jgi:hypothetical protein